MGPRCKTGTAAPSLFTGKRPHRRQDTGHSRRAASTPGPGQTPERVSRHCMPRFCSKRMPLPGAWLVVGSPSVFADPTRSSSALGQQKLPPTPPPTKNQSQKQKSKSRSKSKSKASQSQKPCLLYTSDAADDLLCVDLGGRR